MLYRLPLLLLSMAFLLLSLKTFLGCGISLTHWEVLREDSLHTEILLFGQSSEG